jgi:hypothetical protein
MAQLRVLEKRFPLDMASLSKKGRGQVKLEERGSFGIYEAIGRS